MATYIFSSSTPIYLALARADVCNNAHFMDTFSNKAAHFHGK